MLIFQENCEAESRFKSSLQMINDLQPVTRSYVQGSQVHNSTQ